VASGGPSLNSGGVQGQAAQLGDVSQYMNPYQKNVIDASNAYADQNDAAQLGQLKAQAAGSGAFGDSTYGIAQGQTMGQQTLARQQTNAGLLAHGYDTAQGLNQYDTSNRQQQGLANQTTAQQSDLANQAARQSYATDQLSAAGLLGNLGSAQGADARANASTMNALGQDQRSIEQAQAQAPITLADQLAKLYGQNQMGLFQGNTSTGNASSKSTSNPGLLSNIGDAAKIAAAVAAMAPCDIRLKTDIRPLGKDAEGRNRYSWNYIWGSPGEGYLAQEVLKTEPQAVSKVGSFLMIDHSKMRGQPQWRV
jgi:hypothetical protein